MERFDQFTLVEAIPHTGRTHQIRVYLAAQGHPLAVEALYGNGQSIQISKPGHPLEGKNKLEIPLLKRFGLHAYSLTLAHPMSGLELSFSAPYPKDLTTMRSYLRKNLARNKPC